MCDHHLITLLLLCLHYLLISSLQSVTGQQHVQEVGFPISLSDSHALQSIKLELIDPRGTLHSWNNDSMNGACAWAGIRCIKGHVVSIHLPFKSLRGRISSKIGMLKQLRRLSLHDNLIEGSIPSSLGSLPNLKALYLFNNRLSGFIPPSIGKSSQIKSIDLSHNLLDGLVPLSLGTSSRIHRLNLSFNSLSGSIPSSFSHSPSLVFLALDHNNLTGSILDSWNVSYQLRSLTLEYNSLLGKIPHSLGKLGNLEVLCLSHNKIDGTIPNEITSLLRLRVLDLSYNELSGSIPSSLERISNLTYFNVSYNKLLGKVPSRISSKFNSSSFVGNLHLCGYGSKPCPLPSFSPTKDHKKLSIKDKILIVMGSLLAILFLLCCVLLYFLIRKKTKPTIVLSKAEGASDGGKLVLFDGQFVFTTDDLLSATTDTMGKCQFGTMYKATLEDGNQVVVKRLREKLAKSPKEFEKEAVTLGRIRHPNILPLRAYYLGPKGEKLLVFDYLSKGNLSSFLHDRASDITSDWPARMKIMMGITRGLNHLHGHENLVHGDLTSTNIYLDNQNCPKIANYGIHKLMLDTSELITTKNISSKTDIYSLGLIMLELLTGKSQSDSSDLPEWVASMVKDDKTNEVFDLELMTEVSTTGDQLLNTLTLALHLVDPSPEERPEAQIVYQQLQEINPTLITEESS